MTDTRCLGLIKNFHTIIVKKVRNPHSKFVEDCKTSAEYVSKLTSIVKGFVHEMPTESIQPFED